MKIKNVLVAVALLINQLFGFIACATNEGEPKLAPEFKSSVPNSNATGVLISTDIEVVFDEVVSLSTNHGIKVNDELANVEASLTKLVFTVDLNYETNYNIVIPKGAVVNTFGVPLENEIRFSFSTREGTVISDEGMQFVGKMGVGWNLGNTLDTKNVDETKWGNPRATKELIDAVKAKGFKTLRVPITWQYYMGAAPNYTIQEAWFDRVEEVVNYGLDNDMYVIVNIHHDEEWLIPTYAELDRAKDQLGKIWSQIANRLNTYGDHLIFETLNETRLKDSPNEWKGGTAEGRDCINQFHQVSVDAIRNTKGNNTNRYIMVSTYAASTSEAAINDLILPSTTNLIVAVHSYFPHKFALAKTNFNTTWGTVAEKQALDAELNIIHQKFIANGIPVIMGEWGNLNHDNLQERVKHAQYYAQGCIQRGICPIWWDNGNIDYFGLINRNTYQWMLPEIANAILRTSK